MSPCSTGAMPTGMAPPPFFFPRLASGALVWTRCERRNVAPARARRTATKIAQRRLRWKDGVLLVPEEFTPTAWSKLSFYATAEWINRLYAIWHRARYEESCTLLLEAICVPTLESVLEPLERIEIIVPPTSDAREIFQQLAELYDGRKVELTEGGHIIVMAPTGLEGGYLSGEVFGQLRDWAKRTGTGKAFDSSAGFYITQGQNRSPDAAWVSHARIESVPKQDRKRFAPFCPDFAVEVKSPSDDLSELQAKCLTYVQCGAGSAWLIDPERRTVWTYSAGSEVPAELCAVDSVRGTGALDTFI